MSNLIVFDLDGVITSEEAYWDAAGLTLHELLYSPRYWDVEGLEMRYATSPLCVACSYRNEDSGLGEGEADRQYRPVVTAEESRWLSRAVLPEAEILSLKARAINSNWDVCYAAVCLRLINLLAVLPDISALLPLRPWDAGWLADFRGQQRYITGQTAGLNTHVFDTAIFEGSVGLGLINRFDVYASEVLGCPVRDVFSRYSPLWGLCRDIFQEWYLGDELYSETYGHPPGQRGKPGCVHFERPLLPPVEIGYTLETLSRQGYILGFATGRTYQEAAYPLKLYGFLGYFDERHIATYDDIERAEAELRGHGDQTLLSKPHPFQFLVAADHSYQDIKTRESRTGLAQSSPPLEGAMQSEPFVVVGDSTSDILGGRASGALTVAVLTGARTSEARQLLEQSGPDFIIRDMTKLPELLTSIDSLATIQRLQFTERKKAERLLRRWFARHMHLNAESVTLMPKAVSLNSFNGFYRLNGEEYFFKTHVEEQGVLEEYYHAELLHQAGYNIVRPLQTLHEEGRQMVVYPVVRWPVMFDLVRAVEIGEAEDVSAEMLVAAEKRECERLLSIYEATLAYSTAEENARAPIHQLFWHRLTGGRLKSFYAGKLVSFPHFTSHKGGRRSWEALTYSGFQVPRTSHGQDAGILFEELLKYRWNINGNTYQRTLGELIERGKVVLNPAQEAMTVIGHGDAHFGNVFLEEQKDYLYFDPAFAGRHPLLLDIIKPLYHNVFAAWMYFPQEIARELQLSVSVRGTNIYIEHNYDLAPVRWAILNTKLEYLLAPLLHMLRSRRALPEDWMEIVALALMCCPLLTINLLDQERMPAVISWLGLSQVMEMLSIPGGIHI